MVATLVRQETFQYHFPAKLFLLIQIRENLYIKRNFFSPLLLSLLPPTYILHTMYNNFIAPPNHRKYEKVASLIKKKRKKRKKGQITSRESCCDGARFFYTTRRTRTSKISLFALSQYQTTRERTQNNRFSLYSGQKKKRIFSV